MSGEHRSEAVTTECRGGRQTRTPNLTLRRFREETRRESRREFAAAMAKVARDLGESLEPDENYVARLETGHIKYPGPAYRNVLTAMSGKSMADLGFTRYLPPTWKASNVSGSHQETTAQGVNEPLRRAIAARELEIESFARLVGVHRKTVQQWLAGRIPHPRHRWKACDVLQRPEGELWPPEIANNDHLTESGSCHNKDKQGIKQFVEEAVGARFAGIVNAMTTDQIDFTSKVISATSRLDRR